MMNSILAGCKREYWEHRNTILGLPLLLSALTVLAGVVGVLASAYYQRDERHTFFAEGGELFSFDFLGFYMGVAWLAGIYYLLSCLHSDRKDKSILFWKSLPVSETQNVLTKLLIGCIGFVAVAIIIAWLTSVVMLVSLLMANYLGLVGVQQGADFEFDFSSFLIWPLVSMLMGSLWGAPVFAYVLMVSAAAKRSPFLLLIVPLIVLPVLERMLLRSSYLIDFFSQHLPFGVLRSIANSADMMTFFEYYFLANGASLALGLALAALFTAAAIWCRNNRFEL